MQTEKADIEFLWEEEHIQQEIQDQNHLAAIKLRTPFAERFVERICQQ